jgi:hypothetical protein
MDQKINSLTRQLYTLWTRPFPVLAVPPETALGHRAVGHFDGRRPCFQASKTGQATEGARGQIAGSYKKARHQANKRRGYGRMRGRMSLRQQRYHEMGWAVDSSDQCWLVRRTMIGYPKQWETLQ